MKTTLYLPDSLHRSAKARAAELGVSLTDFLRKAVQDALSAKPKKSFRFRPPTVRLGRLRVDVTSRRSWMDRLD